MYVEYSYKFRLYPNRTQENQILRTLGCCRFVFDHYLAIRKEVYERDIIENIKKVWTEEMGKKESELVDLKIYIKPEDNGAHYVINGDITGFIEL